MNHAQSLPGGVTRLLLETGQQKRVLRVAAVQHLVAGISLALAGYEALHAAEEAHRSLAWFALISGGVLVVAVIRELRETHHPMHSRIGWVDLIAIPSILVEVWHRYLNGGKLHLSYAYIALALLTLLRGFYLPPLLRLRRVEVGAQGLFLRIRLWRFLRLAWDDLAAVEADGGGFVFRLASGKTLRFPLDDVHNRAAAEALVLERWEAVRAERVVGPDASVVAAPSDGSRGGTAS